MDLWRCVTLCHDTLIFDYHGKIHYSGQSQDEIVFLEAAAKSRVACFTKREEDNLQIEVNVNPGETKVEIYKVLKKIEFTSDRKMMTVVLQNVQTNKVYVYTKGADEVMVKKIRDVEKEQETLKYVDEFARKGYRTLVFGMKEYTLKPEYTDEEVECDLKLVGITGLEDELQDDI